MSVCVFGGEGLAPTLTPDLMSVRCFGMLHYSTFYWVVI